MSTAPSAQPKTNPSTTASGSIKEKASMARSTVGITPMIARVVPPVNAAATRVMAREKRAPRPSAAAAATNPNVAGTSTMYVSWSDRCSTLTR